MAAATSDGGKGKNKTVLRPGDKGTKMIKNEVPFGGIGKAVAKGVTKIAEKVVEKGATKAAEKVGMNVGKRIAESTKAPKYPSGAGKPVNIKLQGSATTTSKAGSKATTAKAESVVGTKKAPTEGQRYGSFKAQDTKRTKAIVSGAATAAKEAKPVIVKEKIKTGSKAAAVAGTAGYVAGKNSDKKKGK